MLLAWNTWQGSVSFIGIMDEPKIRYNRDDIPHTNPNPVLCCDPRGAVIFVNPAAVNLCDDLGCRNPETVLPPDHGQRVRQCLAGEIQESAQHTVYGRIFSWVYRCSKDRSCINIYGHEITDYLIRAHGESTTELSGTILSRLDLPLMVVDHRLKVISCNEAARTLVERAQSLAIVDGVLCCGYLSASKQLRSAMVTDRPAGTVLRLPFSEDGSEVELVLLPLRNPEQLSGHPAALVYLHQESAKRVPAIQSLLRDRYGLTDAEARLAGSLLNGASMKESAGSLGISIATARAQLKQIFRKTGTRRQTEFLVKVLGGIIWPVRYLWHQGCDERR